MGQRWNRRLLVLFVICCVLVIRSSTKGTFDSPPKFITKPSNATVKNGQNVDFKCKATGFPVPTITWYKKGVIVRPIGMLRHYVGMLFKTLYIMPVYWSDAGQVTCEASNKHGTIQAHAFLRVVTKTKPTWVVEPQNATLYIGQNVKIPCRASGFPDPKYSWTTGGFPVNLIDYLITVSGDGDMIFASAEFYHSEKYTCKAYNSAGSISKSIYIKVVEDPSIIRDPKDAVGVVGQEIFLQCIVVGSSSTNVTWQKDGRTVKTDTVRRIQDVELDIGDITKMMHTLTIKRALIDDAGSYKCVASNINGVKESKEANISFTGFSIAPTIKLQNQKVKASMKKDVTLKCIFTGIPLPQITWLKEIGNSVLPLGTAISTPLSRDTVESTYTIKHVSNTDGGFYLCMGKNNAGVATGNITLKVEADTRKPEGIPFKSKVTAMRGTNVTLECRFTANPQPEITWIRNGQDLYYTLGQEIIGSHGTYRATYMLAYVKYNHTSKYVCLGQNPHGQTEMTVELIVQGIPMPPTDFDYKMISETDVRLYWKPGMSDGSDVTFIIEYKRSGDTSWTVQEAGHNNSKVLRDSDGWNGVSVIVKARNSHGTSKPSEERYIAYEEIVSNNKPPRAGKSVGQGAVVGGAIGAVLLVVIFVLLLFVMWRKRQKKSRLARQPVQTPSVRYEAPRHHEEENLLEASLYTYAVPVTDIDGAQEARAEENEYETVGVKPESWEVPKRCLTMNKNLGSGHFGKVVKALMKTKTGTKDVAVKMLKENAGAPQKKEFLAELDLMKSLGGHPNIVGLVGCCTKGDNPYIIVEFCSLGNLRDYLRESKGNREYSNLAGGSISLTSSDLLSFMWQVARGMSFLASKKMVHRDLAARNVLVDEGKVCKIADFGLARDIYQENQYLKTTEGELPLRWMAIESIFHGITTIESDVWSFGVLMWEIITLGANPYPGFTREQLISNLHLGYRMPRPPYCNEEVYGVIWQCWKAEPSERPTFTMLCRTLHRMKVAEKILIDLDNFDAEYINAKKDGEPASP